jgi:hypothetical protein
MNARMIAAEYLKLRKRRGLFWWSLALVVGIVALFFGITEVLHLVNPVKYGAVGGIDGLRNTIGGITTGGAIAAVLIGATAGAGDLSAGVFRELVATGRSRWALFAARVPGALLLILPMAVVAFAICAVFIFGFAGGAALPSGALVAKSLAWILLSLGTTTILALGFASLIGNRGTTIGVLIGWLFIAQPLLPGVTVLGGARSALLNVAMDRLAPLADGGFAPNIAIGVATALFVVAAWIAVALGVGAWRTATRDA